MDDFIVALFENTVLFRHYLLEIIHICVQKL